MGETPKVDLKDHIRQPIIRLRPFEALHTALRAAKNDAVAGIELVIELKLTSEELSALKTSAEAVRVLRDKLKLS